MDDLTELYRLAVNDLNKAPLMVIPLAILDFLCIHPFRDGNGRVARLLTLLLLYHFDFEVGRYISLERIFEESKKEYYDTLEASSHGWHEGKHDVFPWMSYFWGVLLRAYNEFEDRVGNIRTGKGAKTDQIRAYVMRTIGPFAISEVEQHLPGISREMIRLVLGQMRDLGQAKLLGRGRGAKWIKQDK
jgi:Fic family protein